MGLVKIYLALSFSQLWEIMDIYAMCSIVQALWSYWINLLIQSFLELDKICVSHYKSDQWGSVPKVRLCSLSNFNSGKRAKFPVNVYLQ